MLTANAAFAQSAAPSIPATQDPAAAEILVYGRIAKDTALSIPQSVEVLDRGLIEFSNSETLGDVLRFVPGASRDGSALDAFGDSYLIRGFAANQTVNGINSSALRQARDTVGIARVEVLKGPASVLYGQLQPGAVVNIVTKQPERFWAGEASLSYGRYRDLRGTVDFTGPIVEGGQARFRFTGAYDNADSFVDFWRRKHLFVAPSIAFDLGDATTVTVESFYTRNRLEGFVNGLPAEGTVLPNPNGRLPHSLGIADPSFEPSIRENYDISARIEHRFSERVKWRAALSWTREKTNEEGVFGLLGWDEQFRTLTRAVLTSVSHGDTWSAHSDLALVVDTGPFVHELVAGGDYTRFERDNISQVGLASSLDVYDPVYSLTVRPQTSLLPGLGSASEDSSRTAGLFVQDRIKLTERVHVVAGARWSHYRQRSEVRQGSGGINLNRQSRTSWTSQLGLLYKAADRVALFANRTTSFLPVEGVTATGSSLEPETGTQYEVGAKAALLAGRLELTAALFHLERGDVAVSDRTNPSARITIGAQVAKGAELSASARPVPGVTLYAGYAYTKAKTTEDTDTTLIGKRIRNIPRHSLVLRSDYEILAGPLNGFSLGGSATYTGARSGDLQDSFELPAYWRVDARLGYAVTDNVRLALSVENLTDKRYYTHAFSLFEVWPGMPRTWRASLTTRF